MKHVTFTRDMTPYHAGGRLVVPDEAARRLEAEGAILADPPDFPEPSAAAAPAAPRPQPRRQRYPTKDAAAPALI